MLGVESSSVNFAHVHHLSVTKLNTWKVRTVIKKIKAQRTDNEQDQPKHDHFWRIGSRQDRVHQDRFEIFSKSALLLKTWRKIKLHFLAGTYFCQKSEKRYFLKSKSKLPPPMTSSVSECFTSDEPWCSQMCPYIERISIKIIWKVTLNRGFCCRRGYIQSVEPQITGLGYSNFSL